MTPEILLLMAALLFIASVWNYSRTEDGSWKLIKAEQNDMKADMLTKADLEKLVVQLKPVFESACAAKVLPLEETVKTQSEAVEKIRKDMEFTRATALAGKNQTINVQILDGRKKTKAGAGVGAMIPPIKSKAKTQ